MTIHPAHTPPAALPPSVVGAGNAPSKTPASTDPFASLIAQNSGDGAGVAEKTQSERSARARRTRGASGTGDERDVTPSADDADDPTAAAVAVPVWLWAVPDQPRSVAVASFEQPPTASAMAATSGSAEPKESTPSSDAGRFAERSCRRETRSRLRCGRQTRALRFGSRAQPRPPVSQRRVRRVLASRSFRTSWARTSSCRTTCRSRRQAARLQRERVESTRPTRRVPLHQRRPIKSGHRRPSSPRRIVPDAHQPRTPTRQVRRAAQRDRRVRVRLQVLSSRVQAVSPYVPRFHRRPLPHRVGRPTTCDLAIERRAVEPCAWRMLRVRLPMASPPWWPR